LQVSWEYSDEIHHAEAVTQLAAEFLAELERLFRHCQSPEAGGFTPSDFPEAESTQPQLAFVIKPKAAALKLDAPLRRCVRIFF